MLIHRVSPLTGKVNSMDVNITEDQYMDWQSGALIQNAMPGLTSDEREFIMSGLTASDWDQIFGDEE
jgi:uncharacterized protein (DUF779 family)